MMKFTNNKNIPLPIAIWLATNNYEYDTDDRVISATSLLKPLKAIHLARKYRENQKEVDVSDLSNLVMGSSIHAGIEEALEPSNIKKVAELLGYNPDKVLDNLVVEKRTKKEINGYVISGQFDMVYKGTVCDIKSTSTWKYILGDGDDYVKQMSIYKWLNPELITSNSGWIFYIFTDWSKAESRRKSDYPQDRIQSKEYMLDNSIEDYINKKTLALRALESVEDDKLPDCTPEERWEKKSVWKYYKGTSRDRSTKNYDNPKEAYDAVAKGGGTVVEVKGESTGCKYCSVQNLCKQFAELKMLGMIGD